MRGEYKPIPRIKIEGGTGGFSGIIMVTDPEGVFRAPPYIEEVRSGSPAPKAGLRSDDLIVYLNGELVTSGKMYKEIMAKTQPGTTISIEVKRGDKLKTVELKLEEQPKVVATPK